MDKPALQDLDKFVDCRYALVEVVSKRARMLVDKGQGDPQYKPVIQAMHELEDHKFTCNLDYEKH